MKTLRKEIWAIAALGCFGGVANAAVAVSWTSPPPSSVYQIGEIVTLFGNANASGLTGGTGLDLALVLDSSGSMSTVSDGKSRNQWLKEASSALVNALPVQSTSVSVVDFDSSAIVRQQLVPLSTGTPAVLSAINAINASGGTNIAAGINAGTGELTSPRHTDGRQQMMVVVSDGQSSDPASAAAAALAAGVDAVHSVGIPGHNPTVMQSIATAGNGVYTNASDLTQLINLFNGTAGNLVGIDHVDVTLNDNSFLGSIAIDGLGNFHLDSAPLVAGINTFEVVAFDTQGNSASALLMLQAVPEPSTYAMLALGLAALAWRRRAAGAFTPACPA